MKNEMPPHSQLALREITLCAATSVNVPATVRALEISLEQIDFAGCKLFTDKPLKLKNSNIEIVVIPRIKSSAEYSAFILSKMVDHIETQHCLVTQWDGYVLNPRRWQDDFLKYDYIGARWPQFTDHHSVGNGGFSLRSRRLMELCRHSSFQSAHPEDVAIGRCNRSWLEKQGMRFATGAIADLFSAERVGDVSQSFGFHGVFNMPRIMDGEAFWDMYRNLEDRQSVRHDFFVILKAVGMNTNGFWRACRMVADRIEYAFYSARS